MTSPDIETDEALRLLSHRPAGLSMSRRRFLQALAVGAGSAAAASAFSNDAWAVVPNAPRDGVVLIVNLYGGNDGLNTVVPYGDPAYYAKRPEVAIAPDAVLPITSGLGLHPRLGFLKQQYDVGNLAIVQGVGTADPDFSHFTSMANLMAGWGGTGSLNTGWLGRFVDGLARPDVLRSISIGWDSVPQTLLGSTQTAVALTSSPGGFGVDQSTWRTDIYAGVRELADRTTGQGPWAGPFVRSLRDQLDVGLAVAPSYDPELTGSNSMKEFSLAARLVNANIGARVISVSIGGFDTHDGQPVAHDHGLRSLNDGLQSFWSVLTPYFQTRTVALVWSEFGRRLLGNMSNGTDHGAAAPMFLMGPKVRGGLHASYPSLTRTLENDQLAMSVDFRCVYAQVLDRWLDADSTELLGHAYTGLDLFRSAPGEDPSAPPPPPVVVPVSSGFVPLSPQRLLDTRSGLGAPARKVGQGEVIDVRLGGAGDVPPTAASAVLVNVTVTEPADAGYLTVWPAGSDRPTASNVNFAAGQTIPNLVLAKLGPQGRVSIFNAGGSSHVLADVVGYFVERGGSGLVPLDPSRLVDTREGSRRALAPGRSMDLQVAGRNGVPSTGAQAVVMNVTAIGPTDGGYLTVWPAGEPMPTASSLNFSAGQTIPNLVVAKLGEGGRVSVFNAFGSTHLAVDVVGYYAVADGAHNVPLRPVRLLDTRSKGKLSGGASIDLIVAGVGGVPAAGVRAVTVNVTAVDPTASGYVTVWPTGATRPNASSLNFRTGENVPNLVIAKVGAANMISLFASDGRTHLIVDLCGYYV